MEETPLRIGLRRQVRRICWVLVQLFKFHKQTENVRKHIVKPENPPEMSENPKKEMKEEWKTDKEERPFFWIVRPIF